LTLDLSASVKKLMTSGYLAAASKKYDQAAGFYTQAIRESPGYSELYAMRALAYEHKGDKQKALEDYCRAVASSSDWQSERIANSRIVQITQPEIERQPMPRFAHNAVLRSTRSGPAPFTIVTPAGLDYLVKLVDHKTKKEVMSIYVRAGSTHKVTVPLGTFQIIGVNGPVWYGAPHYFGEQSEFFKIEPPDGSGVATFYHAGNTVHGKTLRFKVRDGDTPSSRISKEEFEDH
jgi:hypothetical protein